MATLAEIQAAIAALEAAKVVEAQALANLIAVEAVVEGVMGAAQATYEVAVAAFQAELATARANAGFGAAVAARDAAITARIDADVAARDLMLAYEVGP